MIGKRKHDRRDANENFQARVQEARRLVEQGDDAATIAYLLDASVDDVRRVSGQAAGETG